MNNLLSICQDLTIKFNSRSKTPKKTKKKSAARKKKVAKTPSPLREIVGRDVYDVLSFLATYHAPIARKK